MSSPASPVLTVKDVSVHYPVQGGVIKALDGVSLDVYEGEIVAVVGESGCGKTTLGKAILGLQPITQGAIAMNGQSLLHDRKNLGRKIGMVWQDPYASLDPRWRISRSIAEPAALVGESVDVRGLMAEVGLDDRFTNRYPHELSGGQRQRVAIGRALALRPPLVICDEPTSALDLSIRAQILNLLKDIQSSRKCSFLYISHDLMTVRFLANRTAVMYMGQIVESGPTEQLFDSPQHPYTKALLEAAPTLDRLMELPDPIIGEIPDPKLPIAGCKFASRCPLVQADCAHDPVAERATGDRSVLCNHPVGSELLMGGAKA